MAHLSTIELEAGLEHIREAPDDGGTLQLIVRRPAVDEREVVDEGELSLEAGLVGDTWGLRGSRRTPDGGPHPDMQLTIMGARVAGLLAGTLDRWGLAGDQLYIDLDLSTRNLPPGTLLSVGEALICITDQPHTGCAKFSSRFRADALRFVNSDTGRELNLRGVNARVTRPGRIATGDIALKVDRG